MFLVAVLLGGAPDLNFGFVSTFNEPGSPVPTPTTASTTTMVELTTTSLDAVSADDLERSLVEIGFPDVTLEAQGSTVIVRGVVPDDASRRAVLERVLAIETVTEAVDELEVRAAPIPASAEAQLTGSSAVLIGRVPDEVTAEQLRGVLASVYLPRQISTEALEIDPDSAALETFVVTGDVTDRALAEHLTQVFESLNVWAATVEITVVQKPRVETEIDALLSDRPLRFLPGQVEFAAEASTVLDDVASILDQFPTASIEVGSHTDSQAEDAESLSQRRAAAVVAELRQREVEVVLIPAGYGARRPRISPERSSLDREQNERIEFRLLDG